MIKKLLGSLREFKKNSLLAPLYVTGEALMEVIIPLLLAVLIDQGINGNNGSGDMLVLLWVGLGVAVCCLISLFFGVMAGKHAAIAMSGFSKNLRHDMFHKVQGFSFSSIDKFSPSSIITRMTTDVGMVANAFQMVIRMAVRSPAMLIFALIMAFRVNAKISVIFLAAVPVIVAVYLGFSKFVFPVFEKMFKTLDVLNRVVQENLHGIRVVKSFVREKDEEKKFTDTSEKVYKLNLKAERILAFTSPITQLTMYACMLFVSFLGAKLIIAAHGDPMGMTTGQLMSLLSYSMQILSSLMMVSFMYVMLTLSGAAGRRIVEVLDEETDIKDPENPVTHVIDGSVDFENVSFSYQKDPNNCCLSNINLHISSGETVGILGSTGSSKTSLVQLIPRLYDATMGTVKVGGVDVKDYSLFALREAVSMVLQKNELFAGTIYENLRWGNESATDEEVERAAKLSCADEFIKGFPEGYNTFIEQGGTNVSGGQKQRLTIARALLKKPKILILDDSTSAVDTRTDAQIRKAFAEEIPDTTKFIISQRYASVEHADKIIVMDDGQINGIGTHEELLKTNAIYAEVVKTQMKGGNEDEKE